MQTPSSLRLFIAVHLLRLLGRVLPRLLAAQQGVRAEASRQRTTASGRVFEGEYRREAPLDAAPRRAAASSVRY
ncbi:hypothetical protein HCX48_06695 [Rhodocyclus tenuis]|uniref:Secreted protein n=1 Tax=Rhodocyclus gracilis TaxID=2929842 RepID=A0ABX0WJV3_9RHOO|nr:hypothetical protein [Rhodocyclus gracilis]NJA88905.1 hypothetical protein [Rhodocyclus gracilis]